MEELMKILAFDIGGTNIKYALCNENFELTDRHTVPTQAQKGGQELVLKIIRIIESYKDIDRIAISTAGQVDSENGIVVYSTDNIPYSKKSLKTKPVFQHLLKMMLTHLHSVKQDSVQVKARVISLLLHTARVSAAHYFLIINFIKAALLQPVNSVI